jgi:hypothetical protein
MINPMADRLVKFASSITFTVHNLVVFAYEIRRLVVRARVSNFPANQFPNSDLLSSVST